jgi:hypothetical protein
MRTLTILALLAATSSTLLVSTYSAAQVTPVVEAAAQTSEQVQAALDGLVQELLAQDDTLTTEDAVQQAVKTLIESQPSNVNRILEVAFNTYPESAQKIINVATLTKIISGDDATNLALLSGVDASTVSSPTAASGTGGATGAGGNNQPQVANVFTPPVGTGVGSGGGGGGDTTVSTN